MAQSVIYSAFSEKHTVSLTGVSLNQLRHWSDVGLISPSLSSARGADTLGRIYSFGDLVQLRVLNFLRNEAKVPLQHLRKVKAKLSALGVEGWADLTLYALSRRVVFKSADFGALAEALSGQGVLEVPLPAYMRDLQADIATMNRRGNDQFGKVSQSRKILQSEPVFAGTRIPVAAVLHYLAEGYTTEQVLAEYPTLTVEDIRAAAA